MKKLSMFLMGCSLLTLLSFQIPVTEQTAEEEYLPIDTTLGGVDLDENAVIDFDSQNL